MTKQERQKAILALLQEKGELHVQTICRSFHIVAMTARRDLMELEQMGALIRTHGGAIAKEKKTFDAQTPFAKRRKLHTEKKRQLAHIARGFLKEHDRIFLASGSTMDMFASALLHYLPLTVVTDAVNRGICGSPSPHKPSMESSEIRMPSAAISMPPIG